MTFKAKAAWRAPESNYFFFILSKCRPLVTVLNLYIQRRISCKTSHPCSLHSSFFALNFIPRPAVDENILNYAPDNHLQLYPLQWGKKPEDIHLKHCPTSSKWCYLVPGINISRQPWMPNQHPGHLKGDNCVSSTSYVGTYRPHNLTKMQRISTPCSWLQWQEAYDWFLRAAQAYWQARSIFGLGMPCVQARQGGERWHRPKRTSSQQSKFPNRRIFCVGW